MTTRRRASKPAPPKPWWRTPETLRFVGLLCATIFTAWRSTDVAKEQGVSAREGMAAIAGVASAAYARADSAWARADAAEAKVAAWEARRVERAKHRGHADDLPASVAPDGPPQPAPVWSGIRKLFAGIFRPFTGR